MGHKYEVYYWVEDNSNHTGYRMETPYAGGSFSAAVFVLIKYRLSGVHPVFLKWS